MNPIPYLTPYIIEIEHKLNNKPKTMTFLEETTGEYTYNLALMQNFLMTKKRETIKIDKLVH